MTIKMIKSLFIPIICLLIVSVACNRSITIEASGPTETQPVQNLPTLVPPTARPTETQILPSATLVPAATSASTATPAPTPTLHGVVNPSGTLPAGMPAIADGFVMVIDKSGMKIDDDSIGFEIQLEVIGDESHLFRYNAASMRLTDDLGNLYENYINRFGSKCSESDLFDPKQVLVEPNTTVNIEPRISSSYFLWCRDSNNTDIPGYRGYIPIDAKALFLEFDGFGPFTGFSYRFDL